MRVKTWDFTRAVELCEAEIVDRLFTHDGDSRLSRHVTNLRRRPNRYGVSVGKESRSSAKKVDAGVCMIGARMVRRLVLASDAWKSRTKVFVPRRVR
jgi:phage terminase large subunit-like protein